MSMSRGPACALSLAAALFGAVGLARAGDAPRSGGVAPLPIAAALAVPMRAVVVRLPTRAAGPCDVPPPSARATRRALPLLEVGEPVPLPSSLALRETRYEGLPELDRPDTALRSSGLLRRFEERSMLPILADPETPPGTFRVRMTSSRSLVVGWRLSDAILRYEFDYAGFGLGGGGPYIGLSFDF